tara:strand:- start:656 stop:1147 length:492 start_codon:yes stop_codon:yes gene_type:complete
MNQKKENFTVISTGSWVPSDLNNKTDSANIYKIYINDLDLEALIGIHEYEKKKKQKIRINIEIEAYDDFKHINDDIDNVVSYEYIVGDIKKLLKIGHTGLLETLGEKISEVCFKDPRVLNAKINLQKMEVFKETKSVGIEICRKKDVKSKKTVNSMKKKFNKI